MHINSAGGGSGGPHTLRCGCASAIVLAWLKCMSFGTLRSCLVSLIKARRLSTSIYRSFQYVNFKVSERGDSEGFGLTPPQHNGARQKDSYYPLSDDNASVLKETEAEHKKVKPDFF